jgi:pimeloyl-ACP methyl ester carboxylesterase
VLIPVNGIELAVESHGSGDPLVLLHGFTGSAGDWAGVLGDLSRDRRVITVEHRGHGQSTNTGDAATYRFDQLVDDFAGVADALELPPFDLLGHSMGGIVAMRYALRHGDRLRSLILMDTGAQASPPGPAQDMMRGGFTVATEQGLMAVYELIAPFLGTGDDADLARSAMRRSYEQMDVVAFTSLGEELLTHGSVLPQLAALDLPTTVLVGADDGGLRGTSDDLAATIPGAVLEVIADAGHSPQADQPTAWLRVVGDHLRRRP